MSPYYAPNYGMPMMTMVMVPMFMMPQMSPMPPMQMPSFPQSPFSAGMPNPLMNELAKFQSHPVTAPIDKPNVMDIPEPKIGVPTKSAAEALDIVLKGILPAFDRSKTLFEQGFTSLNLMQIVTRCGEHGYNITLQDIIIDPTFDGIASRMSAGKN